MQLNYKQQGQGPDVILIHGLFGSLENLNVIAKPLSEHFNVINVDLRNHGLSPHSNEMNYPAMSQDILDEDDESCRRRVDRVSTVYLDPSRRRLQRRERQRRCGDRPRARPDVFGEDDR